MSSKMLKKLRMTFFVMCCFLLNYFAFVNNNSILFQDSFPNCEDVEWCVFCCCHLEGPEFAGLDGPEPPAPYCNGDGYENNCCHSFDCANTHYQNRDQDGKCGEPGSHALCRNDEGQLYQVLDCSIFLECRNEDCFKPSTKRK